LSLKKTTFFIEISGRICVVPDHPEKKISDFVGNKECLFRFFPPTPTSQGQFGGPSLSLKKTIFLPGSADKYTVVLTVPQKLVIVLTQQI